MNLYPFSSAAAVVPDAEPEVVAAKALPPASNSSLDTITYITVVGLTMYVLQSRNPNLMS